MTIKGQIALPTGDMPEEIWLGWNSGWSCAEHKVDGYGTKYIRTDLAVLKRDINVPEGLEFAISHVRKLDNEMREKNILPPSYSMRVPVDEKQDSDCQIHKVCKAARELLRVKGE